MEIHRSYIQKLKTYFSFDEEEVKQLEANITKNINYRLYYLYKHIRVDNNEVFYIGLGNKNRPHYRYGRNRDWRKVVNETDYKVEILIESDDKEYLKEKEKEYISFYGRKDLGTGTLVNRNAGGDGGDICEETLREAAQKRTITIKNNKKDNKKNLLKKAPY